MRWFDYPAHVHHIAAAKPSSELWRVIVALVMMAVMYLFVTLIYQQAIFSVAGGSADLAQELFDGSTPRAMYLILFNFGLITLSVMAVVRLLHQRSGLSLLGPMARVVPQFLRVTVFLLMLGAVVMLLPPYGMGAPLVLNMAPAKWALLLPVSLVAVFIQISAEEILFRGYLQQQLAARFRSPLVWMIVPSVLFAAGHYQPGEAGENAVLITIWAGVFGMLMADLTARAGSIGPALAVHFVNNATALLITALPDTLGGLALFHTPFDMSDEAALRAWMPVDFALMLCMWLTARLALRR